MVNGLLRIAALAGLGYRVQPVAGLLSGPVAAVLQNFCRGVQRIGEAVGRNQLGFDGRLVGACGAVQDVQRDAGQRGLAGGNRPNIEVQAGGDRLRD
ncbi:hypothetical protein ACU4GD_34215 [Cupriavidus basilensis]